MFLGLDIGTSVTKAALFDEGGRECAQAARKTRLLPAPIGWSELDGDTVWQAVIDVIADLFSSSPYRTAQVRAVGVTGVMVGAWVIDDRGALVRPPILWNDARAQAMVDDMVRRDPDLIAKVFSHSGSIMQLGCTLPALAWLKRHEPQSLEKARHVFCAKDFICHRLTGAVVTDESEAAMAPGSAVTRNFHVEPARLLGIEGLMHLLAPVKRGETEAGRITAEAARLTGLPAGTPVAVGTGDTGACVIGAGCHAPGQAATVLGTTCLNGVLSARAAYEPPNLGLLFILPGQRWMKTIVPTLLRQSSPMRRWVHWRKPPLPGHAASSSCPTFRRAAS